MSHTNRDLVTSLNKIRGDFSSLDVNDNQALIQIGADLEHFILELPEDLSVVSNLLMACLEGLQAIYHKSVADCSALTRAISGAMVVAEQFLASPDNAVCKFLIEQANQTLQRALEHEPQAAARPAEPEPVSATEPASTRASLSSLSLDDVAAMLIPLEPNDQAELLRVRDALREIASSESHPASVSKLIKEAAQSIHEIVQEKAADPALALARAGELLEAATYRELNESDESDEAAPVTDDWELSAEEAQSNDDKAANASAHATESEKFELLPHDVDHGLIGEFIAECREYIEGAEAALLTLEVDAEDKEAINIIFRAFHTIKGTAAFIGITSISKMAHHAESLLSRIRDREIHCTGGYADLALRSADMLKELLQATQDALGGGPINKPAGYDHLMLVLADPEAAGVSDKTKEIPQAPRLGDLLVAEGKAERDDVDAAAESQGEQPIGMTLVKSKSASLVDVAQALRTQQRITGGSNAGSDASIRVRTERLDRLINLVGEMVIAQAMVAQDDIVAGNQNELARKVSHATKIVRELQDLSMGMRMVPLKATFQKMARLVRDLSHKSGKKVEFISEGEDTEIDRHMVDFVADPLVHMVRNALDHGLEMPDDRERVGKSRTGTIRLAAYHVGGSVVVELQDDGRGLDRDKILQKALSKGLIESDNLSDSEIYNLIFAPGFSTADKVTDLSGRGVGMDVVKRNVETLRGRIEINSEPGRGCLFSVRLPLTLAITDGMLVKVGQERFIIPTVNIHLSFRPTADAISTLTGRGEMVMLRDELMPVFRLHRLFDVEGANEDLTQGLLVVVADGRRRCALLVDELLSQQQVVAKSLGEGIGKARGISGGAILGDGRVGLILDTADIIALVRQGSSPGDRKNLAHHQIAPSTYNTNLAAPPKELFS